MRLVPYRPQYLPQMLTLFYETVHTVNAKDYTRPQLDAWAPLQPDIERWESSLNCSYALVALDGDCVAGFGNVDSTGYLDLLFVHKDYQGQGIASQITAALERRAREIHAPAVTVHASITARPFFEKRCYRTVKEQQVFRFGQTLTNFVMELPF